MGPERDRDLELRVRLDGTGIPVEVRVEDPVPPGAQDLAEGFGLHVEAAAGGDEDGERGRRVGRLRRGA